MTRFPDNFLWGAAGAGHQIEGNNIHSDTWFAENVAPSVFRERSGKACNSWELWETDLDLAAAMGLNAHRFSVEWARIEPAPGEVDEAALDRYRQIAAGARARGLAPIVTFGHFTAPHWFAARGGWLHPDAPADFARQVARVMAAFGDLIDVAVTLNEPNLPHLLSWLSLPEHVRAVERATLDACSKAAGVPRYRLANVVLPEEMGAIEDGLAAGHIAARAAIKAARPDLPTGLSIAIVDDQVVGPDPRLRDRKRAEVYGRWLELARDDDFLGVQNYERFYYDATRQVGADGGAPPHGLYASSDPRSLAECLRYAHGETGRPILVTEHGMGTEDDARRARFITESLRALAPVTAELPVLGYCHWSLLDNFEWVFGYDIKLGLHSVDRTSFARTPKPSAGVLGAIARANEVL